MYKDYCEYNLLMKSYFSDFINIRKGVWDPKRNIFFTKCGACIGLDNEFLIRVEEINNNVEQLKLF